MPNTERSKIDVHKVFETEWFSIDAVPNKQADSKPYYRLSCHDSVEVLAITREQKIILVQQFRPALGTFLLELPAGYVSEDESPEQAIARELKEETGYVCGSFTCLGTFRIAPSRINNTLFFFFGKDAKLTGKRPSRDNGIEVVLVTKEEFSKLVNTGKFQEVAGLAACWLAEKGGFF